MLDHAYIITVRRTAAGSKEFHITAPNKTAATERALQMAPNVVFTEQDAEYTILSIRREE